jgi:glycosyltransferase involved in cell wall biosynthesis
VITLVGGLDKAHYFKGVPTLLRAIASTDLSDTRLVIVGQGDLRPKYEEYARQLGVAGRVIFAGSVSEDELPAYHRLGDVFAFPSVDQSEAFGIAALEALACGVPVVSSDLPGVRTIVREGETGLRVPAGSASALAAALVRMLGNEDMRRTMGAAAREMAVKEFSLESRQAKLGKIVNEML